MEPDTSGRRRAESRGGRSREGFIAALVTIVAATALVVAIDRKGGGAPAAATAAAVGRASAASAAPAPPVTEAPTPPPVETSSSSTTTTTAAPPPTPAPRIAAAGPPASPPAPLTLATALEQALGGRSGCLLVEDDGATIFDHDSASPFVPASTQKLLVAAAALSRLGPDFRFETKVVATRPPQDGSLGDAWLVGGGDPFLATPDYAAYLNTKPRTVDLPTTPMAALADELVAQGVRAIPGGLHPDESRYEPQRSVPTWKPSYVSAAEVGSLGALTVNEGLASWGPSQAVAPDPAVGATAALGHLLSDRGVAVPGPGATSAAPSDAVVVVASVRSAPLSQIVAGMLRSSDNYVAEMLVKEIDHQYGGPGLTAGGTARILEEDGRLGLPLDGVHLADGSGLDVGNRATCRALLGAQMLSRLAPFSVLDSGLAIAGHTGTLVHRFVGTPADGRLAAKTGWINGAVAMVGRIAGPPGRRFALVVNGNFGWATAQAIEDRIVALLTSGLAPLG